MAKMISKDNVNGFFALIGDLMLRCHEERLAQCRKEAFCEAREIGLENTFAALYDANVNDEEILRVVCEYWEIPKQEAEDRLIDEKRKAVVRSLRQYMKLQGYRASEIIEFFQTHEVLIKIRRNKDLWKLKDNPAKLFKDIQVHK